LHFNIKKSEIHLKLKCLSETFVSLSTQNIFFPIGVPHRHQVLNGEIANENGLSHDKFTINYKVICIVL